MPGGLYLSNFDQPVGFISPRVLLHGGVLRGSCKLVLGAGAGSLVEEPVCMNVKLGFGDGSLSMAGSESENFMSEVAT